MLAEFARFALALWDVAGILLLVIVFTEYGINGLRRLVRRLRRGPRKRPEKSAAGDAHADAASAVGELQRAVHVDWKPYVEWSQRSYRGPSVTIDARGLRPTPGEMTADADARRVFCFGSSTLMGLGARDDATVPAFLARRLADSGCRAAVTNYGQLGYNSTQELIALCQLLKQGERPHIVLFYDGIIDMLCAEKSGRADTLFNESRRRAEFNLLNSDRRGDLIAAALAVALPGMLRRLRRLTGLPLRGPLPGPAADLSQIDVAQLAAAVVAAYAANLRLVRLLARAYDFRPLFFWQPALTTKRIKSPDEQRFEGYYTSDLASRRRLYAAIVAARRGHPEIAGADDAIDLSALFDEVADPVYIDPFHLSEAGNDAVAEAMLPRVAAALRAAESERTRG